MRIALIVAALMTSAPALAAEPGALPRNEQSLQRLNAEQLRIVRRASRMCDQRPLSMPIRAERNPCVITSTDRAIADSDDPALQEFHAALPATDRYDEFRTDTAWRAMLVGD
jgi:hypothetical protein